MNLRALPLLAGVLVLAGCASGAQGTPSTPRPTARTAATTAPVKTAAPHATTSTGGGSTTVASATDPLKAGEADLRNANYSRAESEFKRAIASGKNLMAAYAGLGAASAQLNDFKTSYTSYRKALKYQPGNPSLLYGAARAALYTANYAMSVTYATQLIKLRPRNVVAYHLRMLAWGRLLKPKQQLSDARHIVQLKPTDPQGNNDLGIAYANSKKYTASLAAFSRAIHLQPKNYAFYQNRAIVENIIKNRKAAAADIRRAIALAPDKATKKLLTDELNRLEKQS